MKVVEGHSTAGYGKSQIKVNYPDSYSDDYAITLLCNGKRLGQILLRNISQLSKILEGLGDDFRIVPCSWAKKYRV